MWPSGGGAQRAGMHAAASPAAERARAISAWHVQAAYFDQDRFVRAVELSEAALVMQSAGDAAAAARQVLTGGVALRTAATQALRSAPVAACALLGAAAALQWPVSPAVEAAVSITASLHLPLVLLLFGASLPARLPERRHAPAVRTVLATRQLGALAVGILLLLSTPRSVEHAMRSAAVLCCLLAPISRQVRGAWPSSAAWPSGQGGSRVSRICVVWPACVPSGIVQPQGAVACSLPHHARL